MTKKSNTNGCLVAIVIQVFVFIIAVFIGLSEPTTGGFSQPFGQGLVNAVFLSFFIGPALTFTFLSFTNFPNSSGSIVLALGFWLVIGVMSISLHYGSLESFYNEMLEKVEEKRPFKPSFEMQFVFSADSTRCRTQTPRNIRLEIPATSSPVELFVSSDSRSLVVTNPCFDMRVDQDLLMNMSGSGIMLMQQGKPATSPVRQHVISLNKDDLTSFLDLVSREEARGVNLTDNCGMEKMTDVIDMQLQIGRSKMKRVVGRQCISDYPEYVMIYEKFKSFTGSMVPELESPTDDSMQTSSSAYDWESELLTLERVRSGKTPAITTPVVSIKKEFGTSLPKPEDLTPEDASRLAMALQTCLFDWEIQQMNLVDTPVTPGIIRMKKPTERPEELCAEITVSNFEDWSSYLFSAANRSDVYAMHYLVLGGKYRSQIVASLRQTYLKQLIELGYSRAYQVMSLQQKISGNKHESISLLLQFYARFDENPTSMKNRIDDLLFSLPDAEIEDVIEHANLALSER